MRSSSSPPPRTFSCFAIILRSTVASPSPVMLFTCAAVIFPSSGTIADGFFRRNNPMSAAYAEHTRTGKNAKVRVPSSTVTMSGELYCRMMSSHIYAKSEERAVTKNTSSSAIRRPSPAGNAVQQTARMTRRLNAADPTIVDGPRDPEKKSPPMVSITLRRIWIGSEAHGN